MMLDSHMIRGGSVNFIKEEAFHQSVLLLTSLSTEMNFQEQLTSAMTH